MEFDKKFGFGCMRLPMNGEEVDYDHFSKMVDEFMASGFNYFDTAHGYIKGKSETAVRKCLVERYPRESYILTDKVSGGFFKTEDDVEVYFNEMLSACGVEYFDYLLMHAQSRHNYPKYQECKVYEKALELKERGLVKHVGLSFHDSPEMLDRILTEHPEMEIVQIQFNYLDIDNPSVESMGCYNVCRKHNKPMIVMEPVKGGSLADLPQEAAAVLKELSGDTPASYALRYAASFEGIEMILSGMSNVEQVRENVRIMADPKPLDEKELSAVERVAAIVKSKEKIPCTKCGYCVEGCPKKIRIPDVFAAYNMIKDGQDGRKSYADAVKDGGKASDCIGCGKCEWSCPQFMDVRKYMKNAAKAFD